MIMKEDIKNVGIDTQSLTYKDNYISGSMYIEYNDSDDFDVLDFSSEFSENSLVKSVDFDISDLYHRNQISDDAVEAIKECLKENLETNFGQNLRYLFD